MSAHWPDANRDLESLREQIGAQTMDVQAARNLIRLDIRPGAHMHAIQALSDASNFRYDVAADWLRLSRPRRAEAAGNGGGISAERPLSSVHHAAWFIQRLELDGTLDETSTAGSAITVGQ